MSAGLIAALAGLALLDSTSVGTLFVPVWLLLSPGRVKAGRVLAYLATIAVFYFVVGLLIVLGAGAVVDAIDDRVALWIQLVVGVGLFAVSFRFDSKRRKKTDTTQRWRDKVTSDGPITALLGVALLAGLVEVATMLPYLGAIGMMTASDLTGATITVVLAGYCLVMIVPAVVLLGARLAVREKIEPLLLRMNNWIVKNAGSATGWILGIAGFLVARDAVVRLFFT